MFALDCEMCSTTARENELTRITIVNEKSEVLYLRTVSDRSLLLFFLITYGLRFLS